MKSQGFVYREMAEGLVLTLGHPDEYDISILLAKLWSI